MLSGFAQPYGDYRYRTVGSKVHRLNFELYKLRNICEGYFNVYIYTYIYLYLFICIFVYMYIYFKFLCCVSVLVLFFHGEQIELNQSYPATYDSNSSLAVWPRRKFVCFFIFSVCFPLQISTS